MFIWWDEQIAVLFAADSSLLVNLSCRYYLIEKFLCCFFVFSLEASTLFPAGSSDNERLEQMQEDHANQIEFNGSNHSFATDI